MNLTPLIEKQFFDWGCKKFPSFDKWVSIERFSFLSNLPEEKVFDYIRKSKIYFGLIIDNRPLIIHPTSVYKRFARRQIKEIAELIAKTKNETLSRGNQ